MYLVRHNCTSGNQCADCPCSCSATSETGFWLNDRSSICGRDGTGMCLTPNTSRTALCTNPSLVHWKTVVLSLGSKCSGNVKLCTSKYVWLMMSLLWWRALQQMLREHRRFKSYCATLCWRWLVFPFFREMEHRWKANDRGKQSTRRKTCHSATSLTTNPTWTKQGSNSGLCGERPATNRLSHGMTLRFDYCWG
jgi:hypothetical protein